MALTKEDRNARARDRYAIKKYKRWAANIAAQGSEALARDVRRLSGIDGSASDHMIVLAWTADTADRIKSIMLLGYSHDDDPMQALRPEVRKWCFENGIAAPYDFEVIARHPDLIFNRGGRTIGTPLDYAQLELLCLNFASEADMIMFKLRWL